MVAAVPQTTNFALNKPTFDYKLYHDLVNANFDVIDAILNQYLAVQNVVGVWQNSTAYTVGQRVIDSIVGTIYNCNIAHTSSASPVLFSADRASNPTYWSSLSQAASARGAWTSGTQYQTNDFVSSGNIFAVAIDAHVSGATFAGDSAHWSYLINLSSFVIPSGVGQALKYLRQNATETGQEYVTPATVLAAINDTSILAQVQASNIFLAAQTISIAFAGEALRLINVDPGAGQGPTLALFRDSASPAVSDVIGAIEWHARSSTAIDRSVAQILGVILDPTNTSEDVELWLRTIVAGTVATRLIIGQGIYTTTATGGDKGTDTVNAKAYYQDGSAVAGRDNLNIIVNPDSAVVQLGTTIAAGSLNDNAYCSDGTRVLLEANGDCSWSQDASFFLSSGFLFSDKLTIVNTNKKFGFFKPVENRDIGQFPTGATVVGSVYVAASGSMTNLKLGLMAWTGTADAITADPISAWNADGVTPTLAAGWQFINVPANILSGSNPYSVTGVIPAGTNNLALFVWNDDKVTTAADVLIATGYQIRRGSILLPYEPINFQQNLARCQRYGVVLSAAAGATIIMAPSFNDTTILAGATLQLPVPLRTLATGITVTNVANFAIKQKAGAFTALTAMTFVASELQRIALNCGVAAGLTAGEGSQLRSNNVNCQLEITGARL